MLRLQHPKGTNWKHLFSISSMSAIISTKAYLCYFNQGPLYLETDGKCSGPLASVQGTHRIPHVIPWSIAEYTRWYHCCNARWLVARCYPFWICLRYVWQKIFNSNRGYNLVCIGWKTAISEARAYLWKDYRKHYRLRFPEYWHVGCWTCH